MKIKFLTIMRTKQTDRKKLNVNTHVLHVSILFGFQMHCQWQLTLYVVNSLVSEEENGFSYSSHSIKSQIWITCVLERWHGEKWTTVPGVAGIAPAKSWRWIGPFVPWPCWTEKTQTCDLSYKCGIWTLPLFPQYYNFTVLDCETRFVLP